MKLKKTALITSAILPIVMFSGVFAADSISISDTTTPQAEITTNSTWNNTLSNGTWDNTLTGSNSLSDNSLNLNLDNSTSSNNSSLIYSSQNTDWYLKSDSDFKYSVNEYLYLELKPWAFDKISTIDVNLKWKNDKTNVVYACSTDQNIMEISFQKYQEKVNKLTDPTKKEECKTKFIYAITDSGLAANTFDFTKGDRFITLKYIDNTMTDIPFNKIEIRDSNNSPVDTFVITPSDSINVTTSSTIVAPAENTTIQKKDISTKKTWLGTNVLLILLTIILFSSYNIKKRIND